MRKDSAQGDGRHFTRNVHVIAAGDLGSLAIPPRSTWRCRRRTTAERDTLVRQLGSAQASTAKVEGEQISAAGEFVAVVFLAQTFGTDQNTIAHLIAVISALPDILAALLIVTIGYAAPKVPRPARKVARRKIARRQHYGLNPKLRVVPNAATIH